MGREVCILGVDPGFASFGWGVVSLNSLGENILDVGVIRTKKSQKKLNVKATDDNFRRSQILAKALHKLIGQWKPIVVVAESVSFPRNASAAAKVAMAWGILSDLCVVYGLPMVQATPQEIKKFLCARQTATKVDIQRSLEDRYVGQFRAFVDNHPATQLEHGFDAVGAVVTCLSSDVIRMARGLAGCEA